MKMNKMIKFATAALFIAAAAVSCCNPEHDEIHSGGFSFVGAVYSSSKSDIFLEFYDDGTAKCSNFDYEKSEIYKYSYNSEANELILEEYKLFIPDEFSSDDSEENGRYMEYDEVINYYKNEYPEILDTKIDMIEDLIKECESVICKTSLAIDTVNKKIENNEELTFDEARFYPTWESEKKENEDMLKSYEAKKDDFIEEKESITKRLELFKYFFVTRAYYCAFNTEDGNVLTLTEKYDPEASVRSFFGNEVGSIIIVSDELFLGINKKGYSGDINKKDANGNLTLENMEDSNDKITVNWAEAVSSDGKSASLKLKVIEDSSEYGFMFFPIVYTFDTLNK